MSSLLSNESIVKASIASAVSISIDKLYFKSTSMKNTLILGLCVGGASYVSSIVVKKNILPSLGTSYDTTLYSAKTIESRILEMSLSIGGAYGVNTLILKNMKPISIMEVLLLFGSSSFVSEYAVDYLFNRNLSYLV